ncbi:MAG: universal stress protein [Chlamydiae bacterium]|nr:universal stress protein [Chlamydiota bacterium]MBI3266338.1 universal stress protein [Chlamydiota bacterium]
MQPTRDTRQLNWLLAWAVVFCDIGTSIYYVPGLLYGHVQDATPFFVLLTTLGFIFLALKYTEIAWRNPEGGGVVTITTKAFGPMWGCLGGMLIIVDYFLTTAISSVSGFHYISSVFPFIEVHITLLACAGLVVLAILNIIGIRESATVALVMALGAFAIDLIVIGLCLIHMSFSQMLEMFRSLSGIYHHLSFYQLLIGFSASWLAFSGLESISQISPAIRFPLRKTTRVAMLAVIVTMVLTSPTLTTLAIAMLSGDVKATQSEHFISELAFVAGGFWPKIAVVLTASSLLLFASNTAIIGTYNVFLALANRGFLPSGITARNSKFNTPHIAIFIATLFPIFIILMTQGKMALLGDMYAFGLLGAFVFSSLSLDVLRWGLGRRGLGFWIGTFTTGIVIVAWAINLVEKDLATLFGGTVTAIGMLIATGVREDWFMHLLQRIPALQRMQERAFQASENLVEEEMKDVMSLAQAIDLKPLYPSSILIALRGTNLNLIREGIIRAKGLGDVALYCVYVEEWPGLFAGDTPHAPNEEGIKILKFVLQEVREKNIQIIPIWMVSYNTAEAIYQAAIELNVTAVMVGSSRRSTFYHMLRGHVIRSLAKKLPHHCRLIICN